MRLVVEVVTESSDVLFYKSFLELADERGLTRG